MQSSFDLRHLAYMIPAYIAMLLYSPKYTITLTLILVALVVSHFLGLI